MYDKGNKRHAWSALASVVIILVIFPDGKFFRLSWVSLRDLRNIAATYKRKQFNASSNITRKYHQNRKPPKPQNQERKGV